MYKKYTDDIIRCVQLIDFNNKELRFKTIFKVEKPNQKLIQNLQLSINAKKKSSLDLTPEADSVGFYHQFDDNDTIPQNNENVKLDNVLNVLDGMKQHFIALYKKEFGLTPKITKAKDGIYIYLFNRGASGVHNAHSQKAVIGTQRYFIGAKDWEYAVQHDDKDFYDRDYVLGTDDYLYSISEDSITLDMSPVKSKAQKEKRGIWNVTYNGKNSTTIYKDVDFVNDAIKFEQGKADYIDNKGNFKNGFGVLHIIKHMGKNRDGWVSEKEIVNIGVAIRNTKPYTKLHKRVYEYYNNFGDRFRIIIGGKANRERTISFYSNRKAGFGNDSQNYIYNQPLDRKEEVYATKGGVPPNY